MSSAGKHHLRVCKPALIATETTYISNNIIDPLYDIILGEWEKGLDHAEEYGWRAWRIKGGRHTVIVWDEGNGYYNLITVEECHHDDSMLDELYAGVAIFADLSIDERERLIKLCKPETVRKLVAEHFEFIYDYGVKIEYDMRPFPLEEQPVQSLAEIIRVAREHGKHEEVIEKLRKSVKEEKFLSIAKALTLHAPDLKNIL